MAEPPSEFPGRRIGPWEIEARIGSGGQGDVYRAHRIEGGFEQIVAIKIVRRQLATPAVIRRFQYEQENLAALNHPYIANLLDTGILPDSRPYFAMELVNGKPIDQFANEQALSVDQRLVLFSKVCEAVAHAHRNLILHLDLKPANILVNQEGLPKLLDFGLARRLPGLGMGTDAEPSAQYHDPFSRPYASPEQVTPGARLTALSDVYSLGAILYELLSGHPPFQIENLSEEAIIRMTREQDPLKPSIAVTRPRLVRSQSGRQIEFDPQKLSAMRASSPGELRRLLKGDLDNVVLVALHKQEGRRYPSVDEMARDISRYLQGKRVLASASNPAYRAARFARKSPIIVYAAALVAVVSFVNVFWTDQARKLEEHSRQNSRVVRSDLCGLAAALRDQVQPLVPGDPGSSAAQLDSLWRAIDRSASCSGR